MGRKKIGAFKSNVLFPISFGFNLRIGRVGSWASKKNIAAG